MTDPEKFARLVKILTFSITAADKVFRIEEPDPWLLHVEVQSSRLATLPRRTLKQNGLLHDRYGLTVHSVIFLLRREADDTGLTGVVSYGKHPRLGGMDFRYRVERVWEWPLADVLSGGLGTLPLAFLSGEVTEADLPRVWKRVQERFRSEAASAEAAKLCTATFILLGLRFPREIAEQLFQGVKAMEESVTYQAIIEKGEAKGEAKWRVEEARRLLLRQGRIRFGPPDAGTEATLAALTDLDRLERLSEQLLQANSWKELLETA